MHMSMLASQTRGKSTHPTMTGTSAKFPFMIEMEGYSVKSLLSITGWKEEYGPVLLCPNH